MKKILLYVFLIVISDPYRGINYNQINVYDVNYCSNYCYNQNDKDYAYFDNEDVEEIEDDYRDEEDSEDSEDNMPLIFNLDDWLKKK